MSEIRAPRGLWQCERCLAKNRPEDRLCRWCALRAQAVEPAPAEPERPRRKRQRRRPRRRPM